MGVDLIAVGHEHQLSSVMVKSWEGDDGEELVDCNNAADAHHVRVRHNEDQVLVLKCNLRGIN